MTATQASENEALLDIFSKLYIYIIQLELTNKI